MLANREWYSIPTTDEVLEYLNQNKYFSKLDLNSAYHQIEWPLSREMSSHSVPMMACTDTNDLCLVYVANQRCTIRSHPLSHKRL